MLLKEICRATAHLSPRATACQALAKKGTKAASTEAATRATPKPVAAAWRAWGGDERALLDSQLAVLGELLQERSHVRCNLRCKAWPTP